MKTEIEFLTELSKDIQTESAWINDENEEKYLISPIHNLIKARLELLNSQKQELFIYDGINCTLEEIDSIEDGMSFIKENFMEGGDIHPDIEDIIIVKKIASVCVTETGKTGELHGDIVPICKVTIQ